MSHHRATKAQRASSRRVARKPPTMEDLPLLFCGQKSYSSWRKRRLSPYLSPCVSLEWTANFLSVSMKTGGRHWRLSGVKPSRDPLDSDWSTDLSIINLDQWVAEIFSRENSPWLSAWLWFDMIQIKLVPTSPKVQVNFLWSIKHLLVHSYSPDITSTLFVKHCWKQQSWSKCSMHT